MIKNFVTTKRTKQEAKNSLLQDMDNESMLYLSSNWSTGIIDYVPLSDSKNIWTRSAKKNGVPRIGI